MTAHDIADSIRAAQRKAWPIDLGLGDVVEAIENPKPLAKDELWARNGKPVWCADNNGNSGWAFVQCQDDVCTDADYRDWEFYEYGWDSKEGWLAYDYELKEATP